ncbi:MAG: hypothetical protein B7Z80_14510 [Rhodospirillales bacterium 20-64-7]|nr:MAG: hypothetical protein B7Z80_14510 [Rhodospirillales bacterium 20-64-7]
MPYAAIINVLILICILVTLVVLKNPLGLLAILVLPNMPYGLMADKSDDEDDEGNPIGFVHHG